MTKSITTPPAEETVTIPKSSFDNMFRMMEQMASEIRELKRMIQPAPKEDRLLSVAEAAEYCGVTRQTIADYRRKKKLTKVVRGARTGYLQSELDKVKEK